MRCLRLCVLLLTLGLVSGCTGSPDTRGPLPDGAALVSAAGTTFSGVRSVHFVIGVNGVLPGFPLRQAEGDATLDGGYATGTADVQVGAGHTKSHFVLRDSTVVWNGDSSETPYTVKAFLGPSGGLTRLLAGVVSARTEGRERVEGIDSFRVDGRVGAAVIGGVLPQIHDDVNVKVWVSQASPAQFVRLWLQVPPSGPHLSPVMIELALTRHGEPLPG